MVRPEKVARRKERKKKKTRMAIVKLFALNANTRRTFNISISSAFYLVFKITLNVKIILKVH